MIVDVQCDDNTIQIAKIVQDEGDVVKVKYLDKVKCLQKKIIIT